MRDYYLVGGPFHDMSVEQLPTAEIHTRLVDVVQVDGASATVGGVIERLRLELFIRENNLRAEP